ncbi:sperm-associated antigen 17 [Plakobranchus ocellatus]|uniref:Sperm-associated antigen 17 n=1 Tax=Plakobranchus ocellatus TaxID=259542 RepID=A0AAV4CXD2_9GAST|nr:sperm-associated antigen 17 [Plakobranchus ocellatus]
MTEIDRALKQFVFESMDLTSVDSNGFILEKDKEGCQVSAIPWDDPYPFFKIMLPQTRRPSADVKCLSVTPDESRSGRYFHLALRSLKITWGVKMCATL